MNFKLSLFFLIISLHLQAQDGANPTAIQNIRKHFYETNGNLETFEKVKVEENITAYGKGGNIYKIVKKKSPKEFIELYFNGSKDELYFIFTSENGRENRYYFHENFMIRWIDEQKQKITPPNQGWRKLHQDHKGFLQLYQPSLEAYFRKKLGMSVPDMSQYTSGFSEWMGESTVDFSSDIILLKKEQQSTIPNTMKKLFIESPEYQQIRQNYKDELDYYAKNNLTSEGELNPDLNLKYYYYSAPNATPIHVLQTSGGQPCSDRLYYVYQAVILEKNGALTLIEIPPIQSIFKLKDSKTTYFYFLEDIDVLIQKLLPNRTLETVLRQVAFSGGCGC